MNAALKIAFILVFAYVALQNILLNDERNRLDRQFGEAAYRAEAAEQELRIHKRMCKVDE